MPYLHLDLAKTYPSEIKRELATRLCRLYADMMLTELWRPNVGIAELGAVPPWRGGAGADHDGPGRDPARPLAGPTSSTGSRHRRHLWRGAGRPEEDGPRRIYRSPRRRDAA